MSDIFRIVFFLLLVNGLPPFVSVLACDRFNHPIDGGRMLSDGHRLFGRNKTFRGILSGTLGGALAFPLLGQNIFVAAGTALLAMAGDLLTSFIKRRTAHKDGADVPILDQLFESLLPLVYLNLFVSLNLLQNGLVLILFIALAYCGSRLWQHITRRPLPKKYPRIIKSSVRYREWKSCHTPLSQWQVWFNLTSFLSDQILLTWFFRITGLYSRGERNAMDIAIERETYYFSDLPASFDGFTLILLTDLHLDGLHGITSRVSGLLEQIDADLCLIGGDIRMKTYGDSSKSIDNLGKMMRSVRAPYGSFGVLGNHDCIEMLPELEDAGIIMLVNDAVSIDNGAASIWLAGVDDPHYYRLDDAIMAAAQVPPGAFILFLAHSPESYIDAAAIGSHLYLCGHTHGGQICLREKTPIITNSRAPRYTATGSWRYGKMHGYTSRGVAPSSIPIRFNCPGEITLITLRKR